MKNSLLDQERDALFFIGEKTTKIYCFPWCEEKQMTENIIQFASRKEAEQSGYRPCKKCCSHLPQGSWEDHNQEIRLVVPKEFNFTENMKYLSTDPNECMYHIKDHKIYKAIQVEKETPLIEISSDHDDFLTIRFVGHTTPSRKWVRAAVARYVREWFDLETDLRPFYQLAESDPFLQKAISQFYGLRLIGIPDLFEAICWGIIGQQINLTFARTLKRRFVETFGRHVEWDGEQYWKFPSPQDIAQLAVSDLTRLQMTARKSEYLIGVAQLMAEGKLTKEHLLGAGGYKEAEKMLVNIRGIGPWTANYVLMRCLRMSSAFPIDDVGLHNAMKLLLGSKNKPSKEEIEKVFSRWNNWEAYATFYLWRFLY
jgi:DNA-3-methyladenine glycosylase II